MHSLMCSGGPVVLVNHNYLAIVYFGWGTWASARVNILTDISQTSSSLLEAVGTVDSYYSEHLHQHPEPRVN